MKTSDRSLSSSAPTFPITAKLCINGHEYLKRQLERRGIDYEALDNGISWCEDIRAAQRICDRFDEQKIEAFFANGYAGYRIRSVPKLGGTPWTVDHDLPVTDEIVIAMGYCELSGSRFEE